MRIAHLFGGPNHGKRLLVGDHIREIRVKHMREPAARMFLRANGFLTHDVPRWVITRGRYLMNVVTMRWEWHDAVAMPND